LLSIFATTFVAGSAGSGVATAFDIFVDGTVAVVVFVVADLGGGLFGDGIADDICLGCVADECSGLSAFSCAGGTCASEIAPIFVDSAITVVVFAVASFGDRAGLSDAGSPDAVVARFGACFAEAFSLCAAGSGVAAFFGSVYTNAFAVCALLVGGAFVIACTTMVAVGLGVGALLSTA
jgi:hypothetical protein